MSTLTIYADNNPADALFRSQDHAGIALQLSKVGVCFEQWQTDQEIVAGDRPESVLAAYKDDIEKLKAEGGYQTVDVISLDAVSNPEVMANVPTLRAKFLSEHRHSEDEVRFFVDGQGLFSLHLGDKVYEVLCQKGDLISVPANTPHWFDMGPTPKFVAIRFFNNTEGWVAHYTGSPIADSFSRLESQ
ncbi:cupin domain-containing protein [Gammaproteobacteria bacterium LSUCC0112]|nr:cupin domain-containing protein [Gammaproteobacteria bacterium LSUCC0112]